MKSTTNPLSASSSSTGNQSSSTGGSGSNGSIVSNVKFSESSVALKTLATRCNLPAIVRLTSSAPGVTVQAAAKCEETGRSVERTPIYVHSVHSIRNVVAESIKIRENLSKKTSIISTSQRYAIPMSYEGLFEVLSADGRAVKPMTTIEELYHCAPSKFLLREPLKGQFANECGQITNSDKQRTIAANEVLRIDGVTNVTSGDSSVGRRMLRCRDCLGQTVFFAFDQRCTVSPVAGATNISGVHDVRQLLEKFRLPVHVRLVSGSRPGDKQFSGCFRLSCAYTAETAFCLPLKRDAAVLPMSLRSDRLVRVHLAANYTPARLLASSECRQYAARCTHTIQMYANSLHTLISSGGGGSGGPRAERGASNARSKISRRASTAATARQRFEETRNRRASCDVRAGEQEEDERCDMLFDQIDDIYRYVRDGGVVPTTRDLARATSIASPPYSESSSSSSDSDSSSSTTTSEENLPPSNRTPYLDEGRRGSQIRKVVRNTRSASFNMKSSSTYSYRKQSNGFDAVTDQLANQQRRKQQQNQQLTSSNSPSTSPPQTLTEFFGGSGARPLTLSSADVGSNEIALMVSNPSNVAVKERTVRFLDSPAEDHDDDFDEVSSGDSSSSGSSDNCNVSPAMRHRSHRHRGRGSVPSEQLTKNSFTAMPLLRQNSIGM